MSEGLSVVAEESERSLSNDMRSSNSEELPVLSEHSESDPARSRASGTRIPSQRGTAARLLRTPASFAENGITDGSASPSSDSESDGEVLITQVRDEQEQELQETLVPIEEARRETVNSDEEWDTDLEVEDEADEHDPTGRSVYIKLCERYGVVPVSYFTRHITDPEVTMIYHGLGAQGTRAIARVLKDNVTLEKLNLSGNWMEGEGGLHMAKMLQENDYITEVVLTDNKFGSVGGYHLAKMLVNNSGLRKVDLSGNEFEDKDAEHFVEVLDQNKFLLTLNLSRNKFGDEAGELLGPAICGNDILQHLDLSWNHIRLRGAEAVGRGIKENIRLKSCNLAWNGLGKEGGKAIAEAIQANQSLLELDISGNRLGVEVAMDIATALRTNEELCTLKMSNNPISTAGAIAIVKAIKENESSAVSFLDLSDIPVEYEYTKVVEEIQQNRTFKELHGIVLRSGNTVEDIGKPQVDPSRKDPLLVLRDHILVRDLRIVDILKRYDVDNVLSVTQEEFATALQELDVPYTREQLDEITKKLDKNHDGRIYYGDIVSDLGGIAEFEQAMSESHTESQDVPVISRQNSSPQNKPTADIETDVNSTTKSNTNSEHG